MSKKTELKLMGVGRVSLEELLLDFEDYLVLWEKGHGMARKIRGLCYRNNGPTDIKGLCRIHFP